VNRLKEKIAVVTGGAHGIGQAVCKLFGEEGAAVYIVDLDEAAAEQTVVDIRSQGGEASFYRADVSEQREAARVVALACEKTGRIDVLCNNAAYLGQFHDLLEATDEEWDRSIQVTLMGTRYFTHEALSRMLPHMQGSIINIVSIQGMVGARTSVAYTTVKAGLLGFTRSVAYDYGKHNIRVNAICPGPIQTRISPQPGDELYRRQVDNTFLGRVGQPREVAQAALFLASDEASYITGAILPVDGGWTAR
jgi:NAD(P)-dependent dehydrogenase (short-subunit alcohol dehydrogenase family)